MNDAEKYILDQIKVHIWGGFDSMETVLQMIEDLIADEGEADAQMLEDAASTEFKTKAEAEKTWPDTTDCNRLDAAFIDLNKLGIVALHNAGYTMSDGFEEVDHAIDERGPKGILGYCFYHGQDLERAVQDGMLDLAFGDLNDTPEGKAKVAYQIKATLEKFGFKPHWDGDTAKRIHIEKIDWKRRTPR